MLYLCILTFSSISCTFRLKEGLIVRLKLNSFKKVVLCSGDTVARYKSHISLEYDTIFDERYSTRISEMDAGTTLIPCTKVTSIHYQTLSKKILFERLAWTICHFVHYQVYYELFLINVTTLSTKMKIFWTLLSRKLTTVKSIPHQFFARRMQATIVCKK